MSNVVKETILINLQTLGMEKQVFLYLCAFFYIDWSWFSKEQFFFIVQIFSMPQNAALND